MTLEMKAAILKEIHAYEESTYPEEGAGLLLGEVINGRTNVSQRS